ncbi:MAG: 23S rRNA (guanosine(2251)-2'-O)-methyltransferase RlmB [Bacillota bacterium]
MKSTQIEGRNPVLEALKSGRPIERLLIAEGQRHGSINKIIALARAQGVDIRMVSQTELENLATTCSHQGVLAVVAEKEYLDLEQLLDEAFARSAQPLILVLDRIEDPHNLGALIRSAEAVGAAGVVIPKRRAVGLTATVAKTAAGALEYVSVARVTNLVQALEAMKRRGFWIVGSDAAAKQYCYDVDLTGPIGLVIGSEGQGMKRLVAESCDFLVRLPMLGQVSSLNASVAGGVLLFEAVRQRLGSERTE